MSQNINAYINGGLFSSRGPWIHGEWRGPYWELILVIRGTMWICEDGKEFELKTGSYLLLEPEKTRVGSKTSDENVSFYWMHFSNPSPGLETIPKTAVLPTFEQVALLCRQLNYYEHNQNYKKDMCEAFLFVILSEIEAQTKGISEIDPQFIAVSEWIRINADISLSVTDVANHFGYNEDYLNRSYKKAFGRTLKEEITLNRMRRIRFFLSETRIPLKEIAEKTGFEDYKLFLKYFKYHQGISPGDFRLLYTQIHTNNK